ncbi:hypothetical protein GLP59_17290 [Sulfitobacter sp. M220]|uniref:hypothetical protein n=1 Tax=Sulfitobacter sp. M220 TaxID=2675333 RepID=UPI001F41F0F0|nr:hypothetical protein [Sulfitobacter sp. M220]MCF7779364.1 hypothetical protein [Sulfitobacter sp. M220]
MKYIAIVLSFLLFLSGCDTPSSSSGATSVKSASNKSGTVSKGRLKVQPSDVDVHASVVSKDSMRSFSVGPVLWQSTSSTQTNVDFQVKVVYALKDNPMTQRIKAERRIVFVEAWPYLNLHRLFPDGKRDVRKYGANVEVYRYNCRKASRMVALTPENNYQVGYITKQEIPIRTKDVAGWRDREITDIKPGGRVLQASLRGISPSANKTCYVKRTRGYFK